VFGEHFHPISEDTGPLLPLSYYGAMKLASEAAISAAAEDFLEQVYVFRFPNVVGPRATHGVIYDFVRKLIKYPHELEVLGDGSQQKPYLHVEELVEAMFFVADKLSERRNWVNIGQIGFGTRVSDIARLVVSEMGGVAKIRNTGGDRGWRGDVPKFDFRVEKLIQLGWKPRLTSDQTIERAVKEIVSEMTQVRGLS
jgi:UDP-glucose 4-epimerase